MALSVEALPAGILSAGPVAPIGAHQLLVFLLQVGLLLGVALLLGRLAQRLNMPPVVGELCAGVLLGPSLLAHVAPGLFAWLVPARPEQVHLLDAVGQLGVLLLVGITGMSIDLGLVRRKGLTVARVSTGGLVVPLAFGIGLGFVLPASLLAGGASGTDRTVFALFVGVAMGVCALPVIAKTLLEMRLLHRNIGQLIISAAAVVDIIGWLMLSIVSAMATTGVRAGQVALSFGYLLVIVAFTFVVGRPLVRATLRLSARSAEPGVTVTAVVALLMLFAAGTQALGMEAIVGAFFGGILIGSAGRTYLDWLAPLRGFVMAVLAPLFFATAGLRMDLTALGRPVVLGAAAAVLAIAIVGTFAGAYVGSRASRLGHWEALALGAGMNARGVIQMIIAMVGLRLGVLSTEMYTIIVLVAIVTSLMAPPMLRYAMRRLAVTAEEREREKVLLGG